MSNDRHGDGERGVIFDVKRFAIHDGPGIRTTVFLKGCPLRCPWCHNPEGISADPQVSFRPARCIGCGRCVAACPADAVVMGENGPITDRDACTVCGRCVAACPAGAREMAGREIGADEVIDIVARDRVFYEESGGGATFSGGEPLAQPAFLAALLAGCRREGIPAALDTCCRADWEVIDGLRPLVDLFLCDIKHVDGETHRAATGEDCALILENIGRLRAAGERVWIRVPVIPGFNDTPETFAAIAETVTGIGRVERVDVLDYNDGGTVKAERYGFSPGWDTTGGRGVPAARLADILAEAGLPVMRGAKT